MIQNTNTTIRKPAQTDDFLRLQDLLYLCLSHWRWFVLSLAVCLGVACYYLLSTPPTYLRKASVLIKEDDKGKNAGDVSSMFADMGLGVSNTNVNNELVAIKSPAVLLEAGKRLNLDVTYSIDGRFHMQQLYGKDLPVTVHFLQLNSGQNASLTIRVKQGNKLELSEFRGVDKNGVAINSDATLIGKVGQILHTPVGKIRIDAAPAYAQYSKDDDSPKLYVNRMSLYAMTEMIEGRLAVSQNSEKTTIVDLAYTDVLTSRAEDVLNAIIDVYRKKWLDDKNQMTVSTSRFITDRLGVIERELGDVDQNISSFKSAHLLPDVETASQMYMAKRQENSSQILALSSKLSMAKYVRNFLTANTGKNQLIPANTGIDDSNIETQINEFNKMQLERNSLVQNSSDQNPLAIDYDHSLAAMRKAIITSIDNYTVTLNSQMASLQADEAQTTSQIANNPNQAKYLQTVGRQQKVKEALYLFLLQKREENELSKAFTAYNTRVLTPPTGSMAPIQPIKRNILLIALALGFLIPVVIIFIRENMNSKVRGRKDLKNITIPFLGEIPYSITPQNRQTLKDKLQFWKKPKEVRQIVVKAGKRDIVNEAFRVLRTNFEFMIGSHPEQNVVVFTSFNPGSGKSHLASNVAMSLAIKDKKVIVIDGDLRHGSASQLVGSPSLGLSDYLNGRTDDISAMVCHGEKHGLAKGLDILPIGTIPPNPTELLFTDRLETLINHLKTSYDYVFIDCPPIEVVADTQIIEQYADRTIFVIRTGLMERSMLPDMEALYKEKKFKNMSYVLNGTKAQGGRYGSYYRYGYGYGYGYGYHYGNSDDKERGGKSGRPMGKGIVK